MVGGPSGFDDDLDAFVADWEAAERDAAKVVREALVELRGMPAPEGALGAAADQARAGLGRWPLDWPPRAAGFGARTPQDDGELLLDLIGATISPREATGLPSDDEASIASLELGDWAGTIIETVRAGPGAAADPEALVEAIDACPEIDGPPIDPAELSAYLLPFELVSPVWQAAGVLDDRRRLTELGAWLLPRALTRAWGVEFDTDR